MKVILLKDVPKLGRKDDVKDVPQGHALNFLIPRKLAIAATPQQLLTIERRKKEALQHKAIADELVKETFRSVAGKVVPLAEKANEQGHLFSKVTVDHVVLAVKQATGATIDAHWVVLANPIKTIGEHVVTLAHAGQRSTFTLLVTAA